MMWLQSEAFWKAVVQGTVDTLQSPTITPIQIIAAETFKPRVAAKAACRIALGIDDHERRRQQLEDARHAALRAKRLARKLQ